MELDIFIVLHDFEKKIWFHFQTYFLPVIGLVDPEKLSPGDIVVRYVKLRN